MNVIQDDIRDAIEKELVGANEQFPLFASLHEAIAVVAEERDEAADALETINALFKTAWGEVKGNRTADALLSFTLIGQKAEHLAIEACQVAALCEKAVQSAAKWNDNTED